MFKKRGDKMKKAKGTVFVEHIQKHLDEMNIDGEVHCKICHMTVEEIYEKYKSQK